MNALAFYNALSAIFPTTLSAEWDHDGIMCLPSPSREVTKVLCTLDVTEEAIAVAVREGCEVILSHHPMIFKPIDAVTAQQSIGRKICELVRNDIAVFSFHTRCDAAEEGINAEMATRLSLQDVETFDGMGRIGTLAAPMPLADFLPLVCRTTLTVPAASYVDAGRPVSRVAIVGGSGLSCYTAALAAGADTFLTGTPRHEMLIEARACGLNVICAGHYETEVFVSNLLAAAAKKVDAKISTCTYDVPVIKWYQTE